MTVSFEEITQKTAKRRATELKSLGSDIANCLIEVTKTINEDALDETNKMPLYVPLDIYFTFEIGNDICDFIQLEVDNKTSDFATEEALNKIKADFKICIDKYIDLYPFFRGKKEDIEYVLNGIKEGLHTFTAKGCLDLLLIQNENIVRITISLKQ